MPLNEHSNTRQYTRYKRHVNESHERVNAETVNKLQSDLNIQQEDTNLVKDKAFEERVYTIFNNNAFANAMFIDYFRTGEFIDMNKSSAGVLIDYEKRQMSIQQTYEDATATSITIYSVHGEDIELNDFFLIVNEYIPVGATIKYYLEIAGGERWPISPNALKLPMHISGNIKHGFRFVVEMKQNSLGEKPLINGYAILYWDAQVEADLGMINPDLQRFPSIEIGEDDGITILVRDRARNDKLVKVLEPLDTVNLSYDKVNGEEEERLVTVDTKYDNYHGIKIAQKHELYYGDYLNSEDETLTVLQKIKQSTVVDGKILKNVHVIKPNTPSLEDRVDEETGQFIGGSSE